jgi:hypothetical protein
LGATPDGGSYIQTIPKRGYRFVAAVKEVQNQPSTLPSDQEVRTGARSASVEDVKSNQAIQQAELGEASNSGSAGGWDWKETGRADGSYLCSLGLPALGLPALGLPALGLPALGFLALGFLVSVPALLYLEGDLGTAHPKYHSLPNVLIVFECSAPSSAQVSVTDEYVNASRAKWR